MSRLREERVRSFRATERGAAARAVGAAAYEAAAWMSRGPRQRDAAAPILHKLFGCIAALSGCVSGHSARASHGGGSWTLDLHF
jgi:hypothetical protein